MRDVVHVGGAELAGRGISERGLYQSIHQAFLGLEEQFADPEEVALKRVPIDAAAGGEGFDGADNRGHAVPPILKDKQNEGENREEHAADGSARGGSALLRRGWRASLLHPRRFALATAGRGAQIEGRHWPEARGHE